MQCIVHKVIIITFIGENLQSISNKQKGESDKKKKKARGKWRKRKQSKDTSIANISTVKEWAKQEEKKRKAEKSRRRRN